MRTPKQQRGIGTLTISLILLFCMTLVAFSTSKSLLFEQKTSANQLRATRAFEAAEAGLEWASAMLSDDRGINGSCAAVTTSGALSFADRYAPYTTGTGFAPSAARPGCSMSMASGVPVFNCSCPDAGTDPALTSTTDPTFTVRFESVNTATVPDGTPDPGSVLVTAYGCTAADSRCVPGSSALSDSFQQLSVILKYKPILTDVPGGPLTTGGNATLGSSAVSIKNIDAATNGTLVNSGGILNGHDFKSTTTLPGAPVENAMITGDLSLSALSTSQDGMFQSFFGTSVAQYKANPKTTVLTAAMCGSNCASAFNAAYAQGARFFYLEADLEVHNGAIGSANEPVSIATSANIKFNGGTNVWGLVYGDSEDFDANGSGNGVLHGALVARNNFSVNGNPDFIYDPDVLKKLQDGTGSILRVPGSWKDF